MQQARSIDLRLEELLKDQEFRREFFLAEASANIARQLIDLRKRRGVNQKEVAQRIGTKQPAISRIEKADYRNWSFNTLSAIAEALDARLRVLIEPAEDVILSYAEKNVSDASEGPGARMASAEMRLAANNTGQPTPSLYASRVGSASIEAAKQYGGEGKNE